MLKNIILLGLLISSFVIAQDGEEAEFIVPLQGTRIVYKLDTVELKTSPDKDLAGIFEQFQSNPDLIHALTMHLRSNIENRIAKLKQQFDENKITEANFQALCIFFRVLGKVDESIQYELKAAKHFNNIDYAVRVLGACVKHGLQKEGIRAAKVLAELSEECKNLPETVTNYFNYRFGNVIQAPKLVLPIDDKPFVLAEYKQPVILFFFTAYEGIESSFPLLNEFNKTIKVIGLCGVSDNVDEKKFLEKVKPTFDVVLSTDVEEEHMKQAWVKWGLCSYPCTVLVNPDGTIDTYDVSDFEQILTFMNKYKK